MESSKSTPTLSTPQRITLLWNLMQLALLDMERSIRVKESRRVRLLVETFHWLPSVALKEISNTRYFRRMLVEFVDEFEDARQYLNLFDKALEQENQPN